MVIGSFALFGNYTVLKYYWISRNTLVSMLYSGIAITDSLTALTALLQVVSFIVVDVSMRVTHLKRVLDLEIFFMCCGASHS